MNDTSITTVTRGDAAVIEWFVSGAPVLEYPAQSWSIDQVAETGRDQICGRPRGEPYKTIDGYNLDWQSYLVTIEQVLAILQYDKDLETTGVPMTAVAVQIRSPDRKTLLAALREGILGSWRINVGGRTQALNLTMPFLFKYFDKVG
jgi:hypothetical protein